MRKFGLQHVGILIVALVVAVVLPSYRSSGRTAPAQPTHVYDVAGCGPVRTDVTRLSQPQVNRMIVCLLNFERSRHGLTAFTEVPTLDVSSRRQSDDMVRRRYFEHVSPDGATPEARIVAAGYSVRPGGMTGENIAWGEGIKGTAAEIVDAWMHSPGHRENILRPQFSEVGVGLTVGNPPGDIKVHHSSATYTTDFGG